MVRCWPVTLSLPHKTGVGNLRPEGQMRSARSFNMARIRIFVYQVRTQHRVKTKLNDKQTHVGSGRTVARKFSIRGLCVSAEGLTFSNWKKLH